MRCLYCMLAWSIVLLGASASVTAQEIRGRINGAVVDSSGAVLPGVTVTATSPSLIQPQTLVTNEEGLYRFVALPAGVYAVTFELAGFRTLKREGVQVVVNQTLTINAQLEVATLEETVTVSGDSPIVDTTTTSVGTNFTKELLTDLPNGRDIWSTMAAAPGIQMLGFDVGGSHAGQQTSWVTYGLSEQTQTRVDGIDVTQGTSLNAGYFDYGSFDEFNLATTGNMADAKVAGANLNITIKSGGDKFSGIWYSDWQGDSTIGDNVPSTFKTANQRDENGFFVTQPLAQGNPTDHQYDLNGNIGGPIWKGRTWFFYSYRNQDQWRYILGLPEQSQSKLTNHTIKATQQLNSKNQIIGLYTWREKLQPLRGYGPNVPLSAAQWQTSHLVPKKIEWTSVVSDRVFVDVLVGHVRFPVPRLPTSDPRGSGVFPADQLQPGRMELTTGRYLDGGAFDSYLDYVRTKPQVHATVSYFKDGWRGAHDFKLGFEAQRDQIHSFQTQPFNIFYRDRDGVPVEVDLYNNPNNATSRTDRQSAYINDNWRLDNHVTLSLGLRMDRYRDGWPDQHLSPDGIPALSGDTRLTSFFAPRDVAARTVASHVSFGPRVGLVYSFGTSKPSAVKAFYARYYFNSTEVFTNLANPASVARQRWSFTDLNGNGVVDGPAELGRLLSTLGGSGFVRVDENLDRPSSDEVSTHYERELGGSMSARASYVYKNVRNDWAEVDLARVSAYTVPVTVTDLGPDGIRGTGDDEALQLFDLPAGTPSDRTFTNPEGYDSDYHNVEVSLNRRFSDRWMLMTSFQHTWSKEFYGVTSTTSALEAAGNTKGFLWRPNQRTFGRERTTTWNYKVSGRYLMPLDVGVSGSYKLQSGGQWGRSLAAALPVAGSETIRVEPANADRAPNVGLVDLRVDRAFNLPFGRVTAIFDLFNALNADTVIAFRTATAANFKEVTALLDPRVLRIGVRYTF